MAAEREPKKPRVAVLQDEGPVEAPAPEPPPTFVQSLGRFLRPVAAGCLFLLVFGVGATLSTLYWMWPEPPVQRGGAIVVLPLVHADDDAKGDEMTKELIAALVEEPLLQVTPAEVSLSLKDDKRDISEIGASLGVRYAVDGKVKPRAEVVDVDLRLSNVEEGSLVFSRTFSKPVGDEQALRADIVTAIREGTLVVEPDEGEQ